MIRAEQTPSNSAAVDLEPVAIRTVIWLDLDTHLPRRIERFFGDRRETTTDVVLAERLEANDATVPLLAMPPYPGATRAVAPRG